MKENRFKNFLESTWFYRLWKLLKQDKNLCSACQKNPADNEYNRLCFNCYYLGLKKTTQGGKKKWKRKEENI